MDYKTQVVIIKMKIRLRRGEEWDVGGRCVMFLTLKFRQSLVGMWT